MTDPTPDHDSDDQIIYCSHHRELIRRAGASARLEQERLERRLRDSKAPGPE